MNILGMLVTIKTTEDYELKNKLLTRLITLLPSQMLREPDEIVTSSIVYEAAHSILSRNMVEGSRSVLRFLSALLRVAARSEDPARAAAARDLLRSSGCLQDMLDLFLGTGMMENESLKALCECLIESCKGCEQNQNFYSRLIPTCVQRCDANNSDILIKLLQCLLLNNGSNINMFIESNGIATIFTRDSIHESSRMELLSIVVQNSTAAKLIRHDTELVKLLFTVEENHNVNHQGSWKMVEWASVILFHLASHIESTDHGWSKEIETKKNNTKSSSDLTVSFLFKPNWDKIQPTYVLKNNKAGKSVGNQNILRNSARAKTKRLEAVSGDQINLDSSIDGLITENDFKPKFVSTPKKKCQDDRSKYETNVAEHNKKLKCHIELKAMNDLQRKLCANNPAPVGNKKLSTSARLFNVVNNSCVSIYNIMGNVFFRSAPHKRRREDLFKVKPNKETETLQSNQTDFHHTGFQGSVHLSCEKNLKRRLGINIKYRKVIVKKLKTGINLYGCDFKKIARVMWSQEKQMTAQVLYSIYRKFIVK